VFSHASPVDVGLEGVVGKDAAVNESDRAARRSPPQARSEIPDALKAGRFKGRATNAQGEIVKSALPVVAVAIVAAAALGWLAPPMLNFLLEEGRWTIGRVAAGWRQQNLLYLLVIAFTNNIDNLGARIAYSVKGVKVRAAINLWISLITFVISSAAAFLGAAARGSSGATFGPVIAMMLLTGLGLFMIAEALGGVPTGERPSAANSANDSPAALDLRTPLAVPDIRFKEGTVLGVALSINNIGGGLSAGMIGLNPFLLGFLSAGVSFIAFLVGNYTAEWFIRRGVTRNAAILGGALMIAMGVRQIVI
jgi:putative sporulation protein YtaF